MADQRYQDQAKTFIAESMQQAIPGLNVDGGSAVNAVMAQGASVITAPLLQEIDHTTSSRDISNPEALSESDMDALLANLLVGRSQGGRSSGFVRAYYDTRVRRSFTGIGAATDDGTLTYSTLTDLAFEPQDHFVDPNGGLFYISIPMTADAEGDVYDVDVGEITKLTNDSSNPVRVTNPDKFRSGTAKQTNTEVLRTAQTAVSTRTPLQNDGIIFFMQSLFSTRLLDLLAVGMGDAEMRRDEIYDLGASASPRFAIGRDGIGGVAQGIHVGGRQDVYMLMRTINYVQQQVDIFADLLADVAMSAGFSGPVFASFAAGTTGTVALGGGKLIIDLGKVNEETVTYSAAAASDIDTYVFTLTSPLVNNHVAGTAVKAVNNGNLSIGPGGDVTVLPVFEVSAVELLDPVTFEAIGSPLPRVEPHDGTAGGDKRPGWYITGAAVFDILSAKEQKKLVIDEKRHVQGNSAAAGANGTTSVFTAGATNYTHYTQPTANFTGYQGRTIDLSGAVAASRTIIQVLSATEVLLSGAPLVPATGTVSYSIDAVYADYNQYPVRLSYYTNTEIAEAQQFLDQDKKRTVCSDSLARAFMPTFIDFTMNYRGNGQALDVRSQILDVLQTAAGTTLGDSERAEFDVSDLINAAYLGGLANYVSTPFEIRVRRMNGDGSYTTRWVNPTPETSGQLAIRLPTLAAGTFVEARLPSTVAAFSVPPRGRLYLGGFSANQEVISYDSVSVDASGKNFTFVLREGSTLGGTPHPADENMGVSVDDFDPANVITDGIITDERTYRPFLGEVVITKL